MLELASDGRYFVTGLKAKLTALAEQTFAKPPATRRRKVWHISTRRSTMAWAT
jgi:hypothetical protein